MWHYITISFRSRRQQILHRFSHHRPGSCTDFRTNNLHYVNISSNFGGNTSVSIRQTKPVTLCRESQAAHNALCGTLAALLVLHLAVRLVTTRLWRSDGRSGSLFIANWNFVSRKQFVYEVKSSGFDKVIGGCWLSSSFYFSVASAKLRKATTSFVMSARPRWTTPLPLDGFSWNLMFYYFSKPYRKKSLFIKI